MQNLPIRRLHKIFYVLLLLHSASNAQLSGRPDRGFQAGNSYAVSDIENINLTGGNLGVNIPLTALPKGRGTSPGFKISLTYDSKLWDSEQIWEEDGRDEFNNQANYVRNLLIPAEEGGWQIYAQYKLNVVYRSRNNQEKCVPFNDNYSKNGYAFKVEMKMPGGGSTTFRPYGTGHHYEDYHKDGFYEINPNGQAHHIHLVTRVNDPDLGTYAFCSATYPQIDTDGMDYYAQDGSGVRLFIPYDTAYANNPLAFNRNWKMFYPDGTIIENKPPDDTILIQRITDANGNQVKIKFDTYNGLSGAKIVDDLGRFIFVGGGPASKVYQSGINGEVLETTINWKNNWVYRKYRTTDVSLTLNIPAEKKYSEIKYNFPMVDEIILPTQAGALKYEFNYHGDETEPPIGPSNYTDGLGEMASVKTPSDAVAEYKFDMPENETVLTTVLDIISNTVKRKDLKYDEIYDGTAIPRTETWLYNIGYAGASVTGPEGTVNSQIHYGKSPYLQDAGTDWRSGLVYSVTNPDGSVISRTWKQQGNPTAQTGQPLNAYLSSETTTITNAGGNPSLKAKKDYEYDQNSNLLEVREYDWIPVAESTYTLKRKTVNTYYNQTLSMDSTTTDSNYYANPNAPAQLKLLKSTEIQDANETPVSRSEFVYDNSPTNPTNGNLTETKVWDSFKAGTYQPYSIPLTTSNSISSTAQYDQYGNPVSATDAKGIQTQITYGDILTPAGTVNGLYPTQTISAYGTPLARTSTAAYDFYTGLVTTATDVDNNVSVVNEYDALGRSTKVRSAAGTPLESWTRTEYNDVARRVIVRSDLETIGDGKKVAVQHYDQLGRVRLSRSIENILTEDPYNEAHGIKVETRYQTGDPNSYQLTSNPFRAATSTAATNEPEMGWTRSMSVNTGRHAETETFSGASLPAPWGSNTASTGKVQTDIDANATTVTDQAGKLRRSISNGLGQLIRVDEPTSSGLGPVSTPNQATYYSYDTLGKMVKVQQGVQSRYFLHDSLGRLLRVRQPEQIVNTALNTTQSVEGNTQWTAGFSYDSNGNVLSAIDAKNVTIANTYDALNRALVRTYSDSTPAVNFTYDDPTILNSKGKLTKVSSSISETRYKSFDKTGRLLTSEQATDGQTYPSGYKYSLAGALIEQTYPSGRVVQNIFENDGDLTAISSKVFNGPFKNYASNINYTASGVIKHLQLGNGLWESAKLNNHDQVTELNLGTSPTDGSLWKLNYDYGELDASGNVDATKNTGNIAKQTIRASTGQLLH